MKFGMRAVNTVCFFLFTMALFTGCQTKQEIVSDVDESEANEIIVFLYAHNIPAEKRQQAATGAGGGQAVRMYGILVPAEQATEAIAILNRNGLPRRPAQSLLNIFSKSGLVSSAQEDQIRYQEGLSGQLAGVIRKIDGVLDANVQISFPQTEEGLGGGPGAEEEREAVRASVYVKHTGILDDPNSQLVTKIKRLVAGSVVGLQIDNVTVVTDRARFSQVPLETTGMIGETPQYEQVWSVVVAQGSVGRFRAIFFTLCIILLILLAFIAWILWKLFPLIQNSGGIGALFSGMRPIRGETETTTASEEEETASPEEEEEL